MDTNSLCVLVENSYMDQLDKIKLLAAVQKLAQYESNPLATMQPCWHYVKINGITEQLDKIMQEVKEVGTARGLRDMSQEVIDVLQGAVTLAYIVSTKFGIDLAEEIEVNKVKNMKRGYFDRE